ncbi:hypothetical protein [Thalassobacillus devorans]|uniref:hypothetical protein n=1 Tax=Thalassobacillus devorans TaxID=279813 RepID=UPI00048ECC80|nr:hypothetical protein [Thalassobacillus devorans]
MKKTIGLTLTILVFVLGGCSFFMSEEDAISKTYEVAKSTFEKNETKTNHKTDSFSLYIPDSMKISEESKSNLILNEGEQTFILFYNPKEERKSKLNYQAASEKDNHLLLKSFEDEGRFGYIRVMPVNEEEKYELQVGVGGVKVTTYAEKASLMDDAEKMMKIANSIAY